MSNEADMPVHTSVSSSKFHVSRACAPGPSPNSMVCSLREAVEAARVPCGNCCGDAERTAYQRICSEVDR